MEQLNTKHRRFIVTPEKAIKLTKASVYLMCIWFPLPNAKKQHFILYRAFFYTSLFLAIALAFLLIIAIKQFCDNIFIVIKSSILTAAIFNYIVKTIAIVIYHRQIQNIKLNMDQFLISANVTERNHFQLCVNKFWKFHAFMTCSYYLTTVGVLIGPLVLPQKFPTDAVYPFPVDHPLIVWIVYIHQCIVGFQCSAGMALDCQIALFLWYLGARYEILASKSKNVITIKNFHAFVEEHQDLLSCTKEIIYPTKIITLATIISTRIGMIFGGIVLASDQSLAVKIQFLTIIISTTVNIFVCVWAADNLMNVSSSLMSDKIFETCCYQPPIMRTKWCFIIQRTQKPIAIKVSGIFSALSFEFYSTFLSTAFSYFTALRVLVKS